MKMFAHGTVLVGIFPLFSTGHACDSLALEFLLSIVLDTFFAELSNGSFVYREEVSKRQ